MSIRFSSAEGSAASSPQNSLSQTSPSNGKSLRLSESPRDSEQQQRNMHLPDASQNSTAFNGEFRSFSSESAYPSVGGEAEGSSREQRSKGNFIQKSQNGVTPSSSSGGLSTAFGAAHLLQGNQIPAVGRKNDQRSDVNTSSSHNAAGRGRKGQSQKANHLLNFHYDHVPRSPQSQMRNSQWNSKPKRQPRIKPYNKDLFLQANFRFLVSDAGDYVLNSSNPDKMLDWDNVALVNLSTSNPVQCPICLETPPLCPQITTCGHIFCFPCVLRFLMMGEEDSKGFRWKKCPICASMISCKDLYNVCITNVKHYCAGDVIDFKLLTRVKTSVIPFEKDQFLSDTFPYSEDGICNVFSKFTLTSDPGLSSKNGMLELSRWINIVESVGGEDVDSLPYVYAARDQLDERRQLWIERQVSEQHNHSPPNTQSIMSNVKDRPPKSKHDNAGHVSSITSLDSKMNGDVLTNQNVVNSPQKLENDVAYADSKTIIRDKDKKQPEDERKFENTEDIDSDMYAFYQAADGQLVILHPLNLKCLLHHFGSYESLPLRISGRILQLEAVSQTESNRKRYRYLSHLPLTTMFQICEIDLNNSLPPSAFYPFIDEIEKRQAERRRRLRKDARDCRRAASALKAQVHPATPIHIGSSEQDRVPSLDDFEVLGEPRNASNSPPALEERKLFSNVTRLGFASAYDSPALNGRQDNGSLCIGSPSDNKNISCGHDSGNIGASNPPNMSFLHAIKAAKSTAQDCSAEASNSKNAVKKGKKASTKILLSTAGGRRY